MLKSNADPSLTGLEPLDVGFARRLVVVQQKPCHPAGRTTQVYLTTCFVADGAMSESSNGFVGVFLKHASGQLFEEQLVGQSAIWLVHFPSWFELFHSKIHLLTVAPTV